MARWLLFKGLMGMRFVAVIVASVTMAFAAESQAAQSTTTAIEIAPPPAAYATDANALRAIAAAELDSAQTANAKRNVVVSLAVANPATDEPTECAVDATLRDARTGAVIAVIDATTKMTGPLSRDDRRALAHAAVRNAARRVIAARDLDR